MRPLALRPPYDLAHCIRCTTRLMTRTGLPAPASGRALQTAFFEKGGKLHPKGFIFKPALPLDGRQILRPSSLYLPRCVFIF